MKSVEYIEKDLLDGWILEVKVDQQHIGNVRRTRDGAKGHIYAYYPGQFNQLTVLYRSPNLSDLKDNLAAKSYR